MKVTEIAAVLRRAATDTQAFAVNNDDLDLANELVLPFIINFLTDKRLQNCRHTPKAMRFKSEDTMWGDRAWPYAHRTRISNECRGFIPTWEL